MDQKVGVGSLCFSEAPFILDSASVVGTKEGQGPLAELFDVIGQDDKFGQDSWEKAECVLQKEALTLAIGKAKLVPEEIRYLFAGDLLGQTMATYFGLKNFQIPMFGLYGACSTCGESIALAAMNIAAGYADYAAAVTSSHFGSAEKQFRFPLEYANQRPLSATWTVTGSAAFILAGATLGKRRGAKVRVSGVTIGKVVDFGIKDSMNMGAAMAPAAWDLIFRNFQDYHRSPKDYDAIITGDLGTVGSEILRGLAEEKGFNLNNVHQDCGVKIFDGTAQGTGAGGSGCGCSATTLSAYYLPKIESGELHRILFVPTGALISPVSFNEGDTVPGIAHGLILENEKYYQKNRTI